MNLADVTGFPARKAEGGATRGRRAYRLRGVPSACGIAPSNIAGALGARAGLFETGEVRVRDRRYHLHQARTATAKGRDDIRADRRGQTEMRSKPRRVRWQLPAACRSEYTSAQPRLRWAGRRSSGAGQGDCQGRKSPRTCSAAETDINSRRQVHRCRPDRNGRFAEIAGRLRAAQLSARGLSRGSKRPRSTIRPTSPSPLARTSAKWKSIRKPAWSKSSTSVPATISATSSIR